MGLGGSALFDLDFIAIFTAYLLLLYGHNASSVFAFGQGLFVDILSGGLHGLFTAIYLGVFGAIFLGCRFFNIQDPKGQLIIVSLAVALKKIAFFLGVTLFSEGVVFSKSYLWMSGVSAIGTGLISPILFYLFNALRSIPWEEPPGTSTEQQ